MKFIMYVDVQSKWRWRLLAANNRIIAESGESYNSRKDCERGIRLVMDTTKKTPVQLQS